MKREGTDLIDPEAVLPGVGVRNLLAWTKPPLYCWIESAVETSTGPAGQTAGSSSRWEFHDDAVDRVRGCCASSARLDISSFGFAVRGCLTVSRVRKLTPARA